jgi:hypothetical protein
MQPSSDEDTARLGEARRRLLLDAFQAAVAGVRARRPDAAFAAEESNGWILRASAPGRLVSLSVCEDKYAGAKSEYVTLAMSSSPLPARYMGRGASKRQIVVPFVPGSASLSEVGERRLAEAAAWFSANLAGEEAPRPSRRRAA